MILTIVFAGLALVVGAAASFAISRRISRPVTAMTRAMQRLAEKDLDVEVPATGQRDEIGAMAQAVLVFKENMALADALAAEQEKEQRASEGRVARIETLNREFDRSHGTVRESVGPPVGELQRKAYGL